MFVLEGLWYFITTLLPILLCVAYVGVGVRLMAYAVQNRVPLKIAPGFGEWAVMAGYCVVWPAALAIWPDLRPALKPMNRRDRDRLAMDREIDAMKDSVKFAAQKEIHRTKMEQLNDQLRQIEESHTVRAIERAKKDADEDHDKREVHLGFDAQVLLHMAEFESDKDAYLETYKLHANSDRTVLWKVSGCSHIGMMTLLECSHCTPIKAALEAKKVREREASKRKRDQRREGIGDSRSFPTSRNRDDDIVDAEFV